MKVEGRGDAFEVGREINEGRVDLKPSPTQGPPTSPSFPYFKHLPLSDPEKPIFNFQQFVNDQELSLGNAPEEVPEMYHCFRHECLLPNRYSKWHEPLE